MLRYLSKGFLVILRGIGDEGRGGSGCELFLLVSGNSRWSGRENAGEGQGEGLAVGLRDCDSERQGEGVTDADEA